MLEHLVGGEQHQADLDLSVVMEQFPSVCSESDIEYNVDTFWDPNSAQICASRKRSYWPCIIALCTCNERYIYFVYADRTVFREFPFKRALKSTIYRKLKYAWDNVG